MSHQTQSNRLARHPGQQGARSSGEYQPEIEKLATGITSTKQSLTLGDFITVGTKKSKKKRSRREDSGSDLESQKRTKNDIESESSSDMELQSPEIEAPPIPMKKLPFHWPKFLVMSGKDDSFKKLHAFAITKGIEGICGEPKNIKRLRSGDLLIEVVKDSQSRSLLKATKICDCPVAVSEHRSMNHCKGVVRSYENITCEESEILHYLAPKGVVGVKRIINRKRGPTAALIITFSGNVLPSSIKMGFEHCKVTPFIPYPLRCFKCQQFGHHGNSCTRKTKCAKCSSTEHCSSHENPCKEPAKCANCHESHAAFDRSCPLWKQEQEVQRLKVTQNISFPEARKIVLNKPTTTYASAVTGKSVKAASTQTEEPLRLSATPCGDQILIPLDRGPAPLSDDGGDLRGHRSPGRTPNHSQPSSPTSDKSLMTHGRITGTQPPRGSGNSSRVPTCQKQTRNNLPKNSDTTKKKPNITPITGPR
jgi:hypothetical protein